MQVVFEDARWRFDKQANRCDTKDTNSGYRVYHDMCVYISMLGFSFHNGQLFLATETYSQQHDYLPLPYVGDLRRAPGGADCLIPSFPQRSWVNWLPSSFRHPWLVIETSVSRPCQGRVARHAEGQTPAVARSGWKYLDGWGWWVPSG